LEIIPMRPIEAYFVEARSRDTTDEVAKDDITGLVNDADLMKEACGVFHEHNNADATCYAIGKVYDAYGSSYGCVSILSEDVAHIIGEAIQEEQEKINFVLISTFLDFMRLCQGRPETYDAWDGYLDLVLARNFASLHENGMRALLLYNDRIIATRLPIVVFTVYQAYETVYG
jgi:hypothetical protein